MKSKKMRSVFILLFCAYIAVFSICFIVLPKEDFSEKEKRQLAVLPEVSLKTVFDGSFEQGFETWLSDHVPGRDQLVAINARYEMISGRNGLNGFVFAPEGQIFAAPEHFNEADILRKCERINRFQEASSVPVDVMIVPTHGYMSSDVLPKPHSPYLDLQLAELIRNNLNASVGFIWPEERLSDSTENLYYNTDHHLTSAGSYAICSEYFDSIGLKMPEKTEYEIETHSGFYGSMYAKAGLWNIDPDEVEIWRSKSLGPVEVSFDDREPSDSMFFESHLGEMDKYPVFLDGNHAFVTIETDKTEKENLLIIRDSFGHCFAPFAADGFHKIALVDMRYYRLPISNLVKEMDIDRVLVLYGTDTFITDGNFAWLK